MRAPPLSRSLPLTVAMLAGCGRLETSPATIDAPQFPGAYAAAACRTFAPCCATYGDTPASDCESRQRDEIQAELDRALQLGARYDPVAAARCIDELTDILASCPTYKTAGYAESCSAAFTDKPTPPGAACSSRWECADDGAIRRTCWLSSSPDGTKTQMSCGNEMRLGLGDRCVDVQDDGCKRPLFCDYNGSGTCRPYARLGEPCVTGSNFGDTCAPGATCDRQGSKMCVAAKKPGEPCVAQEECEGLRCRNGRCAPPLAPYSGLCSGANPP